MIEIRLLGNGAHVVDGRSFEPQGLRRYKKKFEPFAVQMRESFSVETMEGTMKGEVGDWLMVGQEGEMYPCNAAIFAKTYELAPGGCL